MKDLAKNVYFLTPSFVLVLSDRKDYVVTFFSQISKTDPNLKKKKRKRPPSQGIIDTQVCMPHLCGT